MQFCQVCSALGCIPSAAEALNQTTQSTEKYPVGNSLALGWPWTKWSNKASSPLVFIIPFCLKRVPASQAGNFVMCRQRGQHQTCGLGLSVVESQGSSRTDPQGTVSRGHLHGLWHTDVLLGISITVTSRQHFALIGISKCLEYWSRRNRIFLELIFMECIMKRGP